MIAVGIERAGSAVSSPSAAASSKPTNIRMANSRPSKMAPLSATVDGLNTSAVLPVAPPSRITATARIRNGTSDSTMIANWVRTDTWMPIRLTPMVNDEHDQRGDPPRRVEAEVLGAERLQQDPADDRDAGVEGDGGDVVGAGGEDRRSLPERVGDVLVHRAGAREALGHLADQHAESEDADRRQHHHERTDAARQTEEDGAQHRGGEDRAHRQRLRDAVDRAQPAAVMTERSIDRRPARRRSSAGPSRSSWRATVPVPLRTCGR